MYIQTSTKYCETKNNLKEDIIPVLKEFVWNRQKIWNKQDSILHSWLFENSQWQKGNGNI